MALTCADGGRAAGRLTRRCERALAGLFLALAEVERAAGRLIACQRAGADMGDSQMDDFELEHVARDAAAVAWAAERATSSLLSGQVLFGDEDEARAILGRRGAA